MCSFQAVSLVPSQRPAARATAVSPQLYRRRALSSCQGHIPAATLRDLLAVCCMKHRPPSPPKLNSGRCRRRRLQHLAGKKQGPSIVLSAKKSSLVFNNLVFKGACQAKLLKTSDDFFADRTIEGSKSPGTSKLIFGEHSAIDYARS